MSVAFRSDASAGYVVVLKSEEGQDGQDGMLNGVFGRRFTESLCTDAPGNGQITATGALLLLNFAVGQPVALTCPAC